MNAKTKTANAKAAAIAKAARAYYAAHRAAYAARKTQTIAQVNAANAAARMAKPYVPQAAPLPKAAPKNLAALTGAQLLAMLNVAQGVTIAANASNAALFAALTKRRITKRGARKAYKLTARGTALLTRACYALAGTAAQGKRASVARNAARARLASKHARGLTLYVAV